MQNLSKFDFVHYVILLKSLLTLLLNGESKASSNCCETNPLSGHCADGTRPWNSTIFGPYAHLPAQTLSTPHCGLGHCDEAGCGCIGGCRPAAGQPLPNLPDCCHPGPDVLCLDGGPPDIVNFCGVGVCDEVGCGCRGGCRVQVRGEWCAKLFREKDFTQDMGVVWGISHNTCTQIKYDLKGLVILLSGNQIYGSIRTLKGCIRLWSQRNCTGEYITVVYEKADLLNGGDWAPHSASSCDFQNLNPNSTLALEEFRDKIINSSAVVVVTDKRQRSDCCEPLRVARGIAVCLDGGWAKENGFCGLGTCDFLGCGCVGGCRPRGKGRLSWLLDCCHTGQNGQCLDGQPPSDEGHCGLGFCDSRGCGCLGGCRVASPGPGGWSATLYREKNFVDQLGTIVVLAENWTSCIELDKEGRPYDLVQSIRISQDDCIQIYDQNGCFGQGWSLTLNNSKDLGQLPLENKIKSLRSCRRRVVSSEDFLNYTHFEGSNTNEKEKAQNNLYFPIFAFATILLLLAIAVLIIFKHNCGTLKLKQKKIVLDQNIEEPRVNLYESIIGMNKMISESQLNLDGFRVISEGHFGIVSTTTYQGQQVALKELKRGKNEDNFEEELSILASLGQHRNIVKFIGVSLKDNTSLKYLVMEYCALGSIEDYISNFKCYFKDHFHRQISSSSPSLLDTKDLILWSLQISSGMCFLEKSRILHGDLGVRNVLLSTRDCAKITDFGLSKRLYDNENFTYRHRSKNGAKVYFSPFPAPETLLKKESSSASDVWAYGITLCEMFSLCKMPDTEELCKIPSYPEKINYIQKIEKPENSNDEIHKVMKKCWKRNQNDRPNFTELKDIFEKINNQINNSK